ncbi:unnamed protein product, partial [Citrullus colocynthis]
SEQRTPSPLVDPLFPSTLSCCCFFAFVVSMSKPVFVFPHFGYTRPSATPCLFKILSFLSANHSDTSADPSVLYVNPRGSATRLYKDAQICPT